MPDGRTVRYAKGKVDMGFVLRAICLLLLLGLSSSLNAEVAIDEARIRAVLYDGQTHVHLPVRNGFPSEVSARVVVEWLNTDDQAVASTSRTVRIAPGDSELRLPLSLKFCDLRARLHYRLTLQTSNQPPVVSISGLVAMPRIASHVFGVYVSTAGRPGPNAPVRVDAEAVHPISREPVAKITWQAVLSNGDEDRAPQSTDARPGAPAAFTFQLPQRWVEDGDLPSVSIRARVGDFSQEVKLDLWPPPALTARIQTDKPIYQPRQVLRLRAILHGATGKTAANQDVQLEISEPDGQVIHQSNLRSSANGILATEWAIPASAASGAYRIRLSHPDDPAEILAGHTVRIAPYELPDFRVVATPERSAFLVGEPARVTVSVQYLFGKPLPGARVRLLRDELDALPFRGRARWGATKDTNPKALLTGVADTAGQWQAELDLAEDFSRLGEDAQLRFVDVPFIAYATDPTSNREEFARFTVRLSRQPVHVYLLPATIVQGLPVTVYVTTSMADGRPTPARVTVSLGDARFTVDTNRLGVGKLTIPDGSLMQATMHAVATIASGEQGSTTAHVSPSDGEGYLLQTARTLHRQGDAVSLRIQASPGMPPSHQVVVHAIADGKRVATRTVMLRNHQGEVRFPYQPEFQRAVTFVPWSNHSPAIYHYGHRFSVQRVVVFPETTELQLSLQPDRAEARPGDPIALRMQVKDPRGKPQSATLGLAIVDQAVFLRAESQNNRRRLSWFHCIFCEDPQGVEVAGLTLRDVYHFSKDEIHDDALDLVASVLAGSQPVHLFSEDADTYGGWSGWSGIATFSRDMQAFTTAFKALQIEDHQLPRTEEDLARLLGRTWDGARDPWGNPYRARLHFGTTNLTVTVRSAGPDEQWDTADDLEPFRLSRSYFASSDQKVNAILGRLAEYPASPNAVRTVLLDGGFDFDALRDPWGLPYQLSVETSGVRRRIVVISAGADGALGTDDDGRVATWDGGHFLAERKAVAVSLARRPVPQSAEAFQQRLEEDGLFPFVQLDPWGKAYRLVSMRESRYANRVDVEGRRRFQPDGAPAAIEQQSRWPPMTQRLLVLSVRSDGPDGEPDTADDFDLIRFPVVLEELATADDSRPPQVAEGEAEGTVESGSIVGAVRDQSGAMIPGAELTLTNAAGRILQQTRSSGTGDFWLVGVPPGEYTLRVYAPGLRTHVEEGIPLVAGISVRVEIELEVGAIAESVEVQVHSAVLQTESASAAVAVDQLEIATPRVRDFFPETLLWIPELETNRAGSATASFQLADSVTTWKVAAIASTLDGRIAEAEMDLRAFQPFFIDFVPPPALTVGDELDLPAVLRSYLPQPQDVSVTLEPGAWGAAVGQSTASVRIDANGAVPLPFRMKANTINSDARQRITARGATIADAVEKPLKVRPDGQQVKRSFGDITFGSSSIEVEIPSQAIAGATAAELRLYPSVAAMLLESAETLVVMPNQCAEQTISVGYANLIAYQSAQQRGLLTPELEARLLAQVDAAVRATFRLRHPSGGLGYWGSQPPEAAVTAHALQFLVDVNRQSKSHSEATSRAMDSLVGWLAGSQLEDGSWRPLYGADLPRARLSLTASVLRVLAAARASGRAVPQDALTRAFAFVRKETESMLEPYAIAATILAAIELGNEELAREGVEQLLRQAKPERGGYYWDLQLNGLFSWGFVGRLEATALAITAFNRWMLRHPDDSVAKVLRGGLVFLNRSRSSRRAWFATHTSLLAMRAFADAEGILTAGSSGSAEPRVLVNNQLVALPALPPDAGSRQPRFLDLSPHLGPGRNSIAVQLPAGVPPSMATLDLAYWMPWQNPAARQSPTPREHSALLFQLRCQHQQAIAGQPVSCELEAERVGFTGYGMLIAEVGLPPATSPDVASLDALLADARAEVFDYEVRPDRILFYLWPRAGGARAVFRVIPRLGMRALASASLLYDFNNPEHVTELRPERWTVQPQGQVD